MLSPASTAWRIKNYTTITARIRRDGFRRRLKTLWRFSMGYNPSSNVEQAMWTRGRWRIDRVSSRLCCLSLGSTNLEVVLSDMLVESVDDKLYYSHEDELHIQKSAPLFHRMHRVCSATIAARADTSVRRYDGAPLLISGCGAMEDKAGKRHKMAARSAIEGSLGKVSSAGRPQGRGSFWAPFLRRAIFLRYIVIGMIWNSPYISLRARKGKSMKNPTYLPSLRHTLNSNPETTRERERETEGNGASE